MNWVSRITSNGRARPINVQSCRLISDIARKMPRDSSPIRSSDGDWRGQWNTARSDRFDGSRFEYRMPTSKQGTNSGNFRPMAAMPSFSTVPVMMLMLIANNAARKEVMSIDVALVG